MIDSSFVMQIQFEVDNHQMPTGELFAEQRDHWATQYKFNGKELDEETGLYYYGARYYTPEIGIWLSVDPLSDKYPSMSAFMYCAGNPVVLVDPDGREVVITGSESSAAFNQLASTTSKGFKLIFDEKSGSLSYKGKARTKEDKHLKESIDSKSVTVNIVAEKAKVINGENTFTFRDGENYKYGENGMGGGAYGGNEIDANGHVNTYQYVAPEVLDKMDNLVDGFSSGGYMLHEAAESFFGGKMALESGKSSPRDGLPGSTYGVVHELANSISGGNFTKVIENETVRFPNGQVVKDRATGKPLMKTHTYWSRD